MTWKKLGVSAAMVLGVSLGSMTGYAADMDDDKEEPGVQAQGVDELTVSTLCQAIGALRLSDDDKKIKRLTEELYTIWDQRAKSATLSGTAKAGDYVDVRYAISVHDNGRIDLNMIATSRAKFFAEDFSLIVELKDKDDKLLHTIVTKKEIAKAKRVTEINERVRISGSVAAKITKVGKVEVVNEAGCNIM